eukprot:EC849756.1.p5 GENE.EC849756.1~~EC849756.1.p5  ORF type:complete len:70 (-),score=13.52 EC849756.1:74-283(-)
MGWMALWPLSACIKRVWDGLEVQHSWLQQGAQQRRGPTWLPRSLLTSVMRAPMKRGLWPAAQVELELLM